MGTKNQLTERKLSAMSLLSSSRKFRLPMRGIIFGVLASLLVQEAMASQTDQAWNRPATGSHEDNGPVPSQLDSKELPALGSTIPPRNPPVSSPPVAPKTPADTSAKRKGISSSCRQEARCQ